MKKSRLIDEWKVLNQSFTSYFIDGIIKKRKVKNIMLDKNQIIFKLLIRVAGAYLLKRIHVDIDVACSRAMVVRRTLDLIECNP